MEALPATGQVGYPPSIYADACMVDSYVGYPASEVAFASGDVGGSVLVRLAG